MPDDPLVVVSLKRKVRSLDTNLLEWRRCACTFTTSDSSCQLVLELSDEDVDDVVLDDAEGDREEEQQGSKDYRGGDKDYESRRGKCRVTIDLGSGLKRIEQKRKAKTRCKIEHWDYSAAHSSRNSQSDRRVRTEELMASSAKHCQQFIDQVREAERQAKRKQSIRLGAVLAANAATLAPAPGLVSGSGASSGHGSRGFNLGVPLRGSQISPPKIQTDRLRIPSATSFKSSSSTNTSNVVAAASGGILGVSAYSSSGKSEEISPACITTAASSAAASGSGASILNAEAPASAVNANSSLLGAPFSSAASSHHRHEGADISREQPKFWSPSHRAACARDYESDTLDSSSGGISPRAPTSPPVGSRDPPNSNLSTNNSLASSQVSNSGSSTVGKVLFLSSKPLPQEIFAKRLASLRMGTGDREGRGSNQQLQHQESDDEADDDDDDDDESFDNRRRARMEKLMRSPTNPSSSSSRTPRLSSLPSSRVNRRPSLGKRDPRERSTTTTPGKSALLRRRTSGATASVAALAANLNRLRLRDRTDPHHSNNDFDGHDDDHDGDDSTNNHAELHILMRVEAALRQLEKENAMAKEREALLAQEVQSLRDALRVKSAEKKHVETQFHQLLCEKDEWKQVAQRAESAIGQIEDELLIAREEAQLLQSEKVRLKHQNKELMTHVHRLDSLVYGRF